MKSSRVARRREPAFSASEEDLGGRLVLAALSHELDSAVEIRFAAGEALRERQRIAGLHEHMQPPALDLRALVRFGLSSLRRLAHRGLRSPSHRRTLPTEVCVLAPVSRLARPALQAAPAPVRPTRRAFAR